MFGAFELCSITTGLLRSFLFLLLTNYFTYNVMNRRYNVHIVNLKSFIKTQPTPFRELWIHEELLVSNIWTQYRTTHHNTKWNSKTQKWSWRNTPPDTSSRGLFWRLYGEFAKTYIRISHIKRIKNPCLNSPSQYLLVKSDKKGSLT